MTTKLAIFFGVCIFALSTSVLQAEGEPKFPKGEKEGRSGGGEFEKEGKQDSKPGDQRANSGDLAKPRPGEFNEDFAPKFPDVGEPKVEEEEFPRGANRPRVHPTINRSTIDSPRCYATSKRWRGIPARGGANGQLDDFETNGRGVDRRRELFECGEGLAARPRIIDMFPSVFKGLDATEIPRGSVYVWAPRGKQDPFLGWDMADKNNWEVDGEPATKMWGEADQLLFDLDINDAYLKTGLTHYAYEMNITKRYAGTIYLLGAPSLGEGAKQFSDETRLNLVGKQSSWLGGTINANSKFFLTLEREHKFNVAADIKKYGELGNFEIEDNVSINLLGVSNPSRRMFFETHMTIHGDNVDFNAVTNGQIVSGEINVFGSAILNLSVHKDAKGVVRLFSGPLYLHNLAETRLNLRNSSNVTAYLGNLLCHPREDEKAEIIHHSGAWMASNLSVAKNCNYIIKQSAEGGKMIANRLTFRNGSVLTNNQASKNAVKSKGFEFNSTSGWVSFGDASKKGDPAKIHFSNRFKEKHSTLRFNKIYLNYADIYMGATVRNSKLVDNDIIRTMRRIRTEPNVFANQVTLSVNINGDRTIYPDVIHLIKGISAPNFRGVRHNKFWGHRLESGWDPFFWIQQKKRGE